MVFYNDSRDASLYGGKGCAYQPRTADSDSLNVRAQYLLMSGHSSSSINHKMQSFPLLEASAT